MNNRQNIWKLSSGYLFLMVLAVICVLLAYQNGLLQLVHVWENKEEYSHGYMIPLIALFLAWLKKDVIEATELRGVWLGVVVVLLAGLLLLIGRLSAVYDVEQYGFLIAVYGLVFAFVGWGGAKLLWASLVMLVFMIPLPGFLYNDLSLQLQLISSKLGVAFIRLFDISVYLEGNVIDLGNYKLQVVEACSGLRYLFPLMSLSFLAAYFFNASLMKRLVVFLSAIPITILMNSFRIGAIGVTVEYWGVAMADGFLHDFEGWVVFMASTAALVLVIWVLSRIGKDRTTLRESFGIVWPVPTPKDVSYQKRTIPLTAVVSVVLVAVSGATVATMSDRETFVPERKSFAEFPGKLGRWSGGQDKLESIYLDMLKLDDYLLSSYQNADGGNVNLYMAYYGSQESGESVHSPRNCIPGGGWVITELKEYLVPGISMNGQPLNVNRVVIQQGEVKQLVYYWFQQRGRDLTGELETRWFIMWDSLNRNRSDGALVRLTTMVPPREGLEKADQRLKEFAENMIPLLGNYVPN